MPRVGHPFAGPVEQPHLHGIVPGRPEAIRPREVPKSAEHDFRADALRPAGGDDQVGRPDLHHAVVPHAPHLERG